MTTAKTALVHIVARVKWVGYSSRFQMPNARVVSQYIQYSISIMNLHTTRCRRAAAIICPRPSPRPLPPWAPKRLMRPSRRQRSRNFPWPTRSHAHCCSRLTREHGGEQSGLVTLTFDILTLKVVSESRDVGYLCANFGLPRPLCSRFSPDVRDRRRHTASSLYAPRLLGAGA